MANEQPASGAEGIRPSSDGGMERGKPSAPLSVSQGGGGVLDTSPSDSHDSTIQLEASPERGTFELVGGYLDDKGHLYNVIDLRAMGGVEEELLNDQSMPVIHRLTEMMVHSARMIRSVDEGADPIDGENQLRHAISKMPSHTRTHMLISMRRATHWRRHKDDYHMKVKCPNKPECGREDTYTIDLGKLDVFPMPDPRKRHYDTKLLDEGMEVTWEVANGDTDLITQIAARKNEKEAMTYGIAVRLRAFDGEDLRLGLNDWLNPPRTGLDLSRRASRLLEIVRGWSMGDRDDLRSDFMEYEPAVDTDIEFRCKHCGEEFWGLLDVIQPGFFFPSATSQRRSKRRST